MGTLTNGIFSITSIAEIITEYYKKNNIKLFNPERTKEITKEDEFMLYIIIKKYIKVYFIFLKNILINVYLIFIIC